MRSLLILSALLSNACAQLDAGEVEDDDIDPAGADAGTADAVIEIAPTITRDFVETDAQFLNPERGYYVGYDLRGASSSAAASVRNGGKSLAIALVRLDAYRDAPLDAALLESLDDGFAEARAAGIKIVLRFMYNSSFSADAPRARILQHLEQLTPLLHANADVIAVMQAGFVGAWGEWHGSTNGLDDDPEDRAAILEGLLAALPAHRAVQVRKPSFKEIAFPGGALTAAEAFSDAPRARLGHHNDCFLASETDLGTYDAPMTTWASYVEDDSRYLPIGGETCKVYEPRTTCAVALAEMAGKHWSYLNSQYHQTVLAGWEDQGCADEVRRRLGYRFALDQVTHTEVVAPGGELALEIDLHNTGFAAPFNRRPVEVVIDDGVTRHVLPLTGVDARAWAPGQNVTLTARLQLPADLAVGVATLSLRLPDDAASLADDPRYAIRFANEGVWRDATGDNVLTDTLVVADL